VVGADMRIWRIARQGVKGDKDRTRRITKRQGRLLPVPLMLAPPKSRPMYERSRLLSRSSWQHVNVGPRQSLNVEEHVGPALCQKSGVNPIALSRIYDEE